jgi:hypothetical protein
MAGSLADDEDAQVVGSMRVARFGMMTSESTAGFRHAYR